MKTRYFFGRRTVYAKASVGRRSVRLPGYDYGETGDYFVTICAAQRQNLFGRVDGRRVRLNRLGEVVKNEIKNTARLRRGVSIPQYIIMPDHVHLIIRFHSCRGVRHYAPTGGNAGLGRKRQCAKNAHSCGDMNIGAGL